MLILAALLACSEPRDDLLTASFVDPADVARISMYRSCCGHDYSTRGEPNRSMKHYVHPTEAFGVRNDEMRVLAPFAGRVRRIADDSRELPCFDDVHGSRMYLRPDAQPGVYIKLFHVNPVLEDGDRFEAGDHVAWADLRECDPSDPSRVADHPSSFDIALERADHPFPVFTQMTEAAWSPWRDGLEVDDPSGTVISAEARDADPCTDYWLECGDDMLGLWGNEAYPPYW